MLGLSNVLLSTPSILPNLFNVPISPAPPPPPPFHLEEENSGAAGAAELKG